MEFEFDDFEIIESEKKPLYKGNQFNDKLIYLNSTLARQLHFSDSEEKLFAMAISQLDFYAENADFSVTIRVKDVQEKLKLAKDGAFYTNLRKQYRSLMKKTVVDFELGNEDHDWIVGSLISTVHSNKRKGSITVKFNEDLKPALHFCKIAFCKIPLDDTLSYDSQYAIILQRYLTSLYRSAESGAPMLQTFDFTTKQLKEVFGLGEQDYCYKKGKNIGKFDRPSFEKKTLQKACDEINQKSQCMRIEWGKERVRGVIYYRISCAIATKIKKDPAPVENDWEEQESDTGEPIEQSFMHF